MQVYARIIVFYYIIILIDKKCFYPYKQNLLSVVD